MRVALLRLVTKRRTLGNLCFALRKRERITDRLLRLLNEWSIPSRRTDPVVP